MRVLVRMLFFFLIILNTIVTFRNIIFENNRYPLDIHTSSFDIDILVAYWFNPSPTTDLQDFGRLGHKWCKGDKYIFFGSHVHGKVFFFLFSVLLIIKNLKILRVIIAHLQIW